VNAVKLFVAGLAAALVTGTAEAATLGFVATTTCLSNCAAAGLGQGETVTARLNVDSAGFTPNGFLQNDDLLGFSVSFGGSTVSKRNAFGSSFFAQWGATERDITSFSLQAANTEAPTAGPAFGLSDLIGSAFTRDGFCQNATCGVIELGDSAEAAPASISAIPLPPALLLVASGIAALGLVARRRRAAA
jgi:hypothetical protein